MKGLHKILAFSGNSAHPSLIYRVLVSRYIFSYLIECIHTLSHNRLEEQSIDEILLNISLLFVSKSILTTLLA